VGTGAISFLLHFSSLYWILINKEKDRILWREFCSRGTFCLFSRNPNRERKKELPRNRQLAFSSLLATKVASPLSSVLHPTNPCEKSHCLLIDLTQRASTLEIGRESVGESQSKSKTLSENGNPQVREKYGRIGRRERRERRSGNGEHR
jgi:hypothetical protein